MREKCTKMHFEAHASPKQVNACSEDTYIAQK